MIQYYSPHFGVIDLLKTVFFRNSEEKLCDYFRILTGKKYVLITSSCRSALYLAYKAIGKKGIVHTSPLTCKIALLPIIASGNQIYFNDIKEDDWTINPSTIPVTISEKSIAIQAIHFGGFPCDLPSLRKIADKHNLILIEDCAQGFGAFNSGIATGRFGDISCFTLTKNLYGIGGGVFVTNNEEWYIHAKNIQSIFKRETNIKVIYRIIQALLSSFRKYEPVNCIYNILKKVNRNKHQSYDLYYNFSIFLTKPSKLYISSVCSRLNKIQELVNKRKIIGMSLAQALSNLGVVISYSTSSSSSYTKFFCTTQNKSKNLIQSLNKAGIEAMHLEHKDKAYYQEKLIYDPLFTNHIIYKDLDVYDKIHDNLISLPLNDCDVSSIDKIIRVLKDIIGNKW